jgi:hypothetical protein
MPEKPWEEERREEPYYTWNRGMAMGPSPGSIPPEYSLWAINTDAARGGLRNRLGRGRVGDRLPAGSATCYWLGQLRIRGTAGSVTRSYLRINRFDLFQLTGEPDPTGVWAPKGSVSVARLVCGQQWFNKMWFGDGASTKVWDGDTLQEWGWLAPPPPVFVSESTPGGNLFNAKTYQLGYTLFDPFQGDIDTAEETDVSTALEHLLVVAGDVSLVNATIPAQSAPARFTQARLYRSAADEAVMRREATVAFTGGGDAVVYGTKTDSNLGALAPVGVNVPPPRLDRFLIFENRFFGWERFSSVLRWSKTNSPWAWPTEYAMNLNLDDGDEIRGAFQMHGTLYVLKRRSAWAINPDPIFLYAATQLPADIGCLSHFSIVIVANYAYGYDERGFWRFNGAQFDRLTDNNMDFFLSARRNAQALDAYGVYDARPDRPYYRVILDGPDPRTPGTSRRWWVNLFEPTMGVSLIQGWDAKVVSQVEGQSEDDQGNPLHVPEVWSGDEQGAVYRHFEDKDGVNVYTDDDPDAVPQPIAWDYRSADIALGVANPGQGQSPTPTYSSKYWHQLFVELGRSDDGPTPNILFTSYLDGLQSTSQTLAGAGAGQAITGVHRWNVGGTPCRRAGFRLSGSATADARVEGVVFEWTPAGTRIKGVP